MQEEILCGRWLIQRKRRMRVIELWEIVEVKGVAG